MSSEPIPPTPSSSSSSAPAAPTSSLTPPAAAPKPKAARSARGNKSDDADTRHSKTLSYILRHGAAKESLVLRPDGFVRVEELLKRPKLKELDLEGLKKIVEKDSKSRYTLRGEGTGVRGEEELWIRANQGHSVEVQALELKKVERSEEVPIMVHGTYFKFWDSILKDGLKKMTRNHVHCAVGLFGESGVTSGMRNNCDLFIYLNVALMLSDQIPIFTSSNNVVLTSGVGPEGVVEKKYFEKVVRKQKGGAEGEGEVLWP